MEKKKILLVTDRQPPELKEDFLEASRFKIEIARGLQSGSFALAGRGFDAVVADLNDVHSQVDLFKEAREANFWIKTVSVASFPLDIFLSALVSPGLCFNAVSGTPEPEMRELAFTVEKLFSGDIFGIEKYCPRGSKFFESQLQHSSQKKGSLEEAVDFAKEFTQDHRILGALQDIIDELLMNAFFDAPCNEKGEYLYTHTDRSKTISLNKQEEIILRCACDGKNMVISVTDSFGSLERGAFIEHLVKCTSTSEAQVQIKLGGSGVGIYNILERVSSFNVNLYPHKKTEVICILGLGSSMREFQKKAKSFHIFTAQEQIGMGESLSVERREASGALLLNFYGTIDENALFGRLFETEKKKITVNLRGVKRINSCGVREWVNALRSIPREKKLEFSECSLAMVKQFNMIANFGDHGKITSFMAPYFCPRCNRLFEKLVVVEESLDKLLNLKSPDFSCPVCKDMLTFDDLEDKYLQFILRQEGTV